MTASLIWISFDLGVRGDYEGFYTWLDQNDAKECGDSVAVIKYEYSKDLLGTLEKDLRKSIETTKKTRVYVMYKDPKTKRIKGKFIIGGRKASPWEGYAVKVTAEDEGAD